MHRLVFRPKLVIFCKLQVRIKLLIPFASPPREAVYRKK